MACGLAKAKGPWVSPVEGVLADGSALWLGCCPEGLGMCLSCGGSCKDA